MNSNSNQYEEQLSLFSLNPTSDEQTPPLTVGKAKIDYIKSTSLLTTPGGFIGAYKFTLNPYSGCSFGCDYCYARFFAPKLQQQQDWGYWVKVKEKLLEVTYYVF